MEVVPLIISSCERGIQRHTQNADTEKKKKVRRKGYCQSAATPFSIKSTSLSQLSPFSRWDFPAVCQHVTVCLLSCISSSSGDTGVHKGFYRSNRKKKVLLSGVLGKIIIHGGKLSDVVWDLYVFSDCF